MVGVTVAAIVLMEDDATLCEVIAFHLRRAGHEVQTAADGVAGLQCARAAHADLVLLDVMMPRLSGLEVLKTLRTESTVPIMVISARDAEADKLAGFDLGADDYLTKPFSMRELMARVEAVLRRTEQAPPPPSKDVAVVLDTARHEVSTRGERVRLAPKEFELLAYLTERPNRVVSRPDILEAVWGYRGADTRTVDVHIYWLRQKIEVDPKAPRHLITVRQYGYKFVPEGDPDAA